MTPGPSPPSPTATGACGAATPGRHRLAQPTVAPAGPAADRLRLPLLECGGRCPPVDTPTWIGAWTGPGWRASPPRAPPPPAPRSPAGRPGASPRLAPDGPILAMSLVRARWRLGGRTRGGLP